MAGFYINHSAFAELARNSPPNTRPIPSATFAGSLGACQWLLNGNFPPNTNDTIFTNGLLGLSASGSIKKERCWRAVYEAIIRVLVYICGYPFQTTRDYVFGHTSVVNRLLYALEHDFCQKIEQNTTEWQRLPMRLREGLFKT